MFVNGNGSHSDRAMEIGPGADENSIGDRGVYQFLPRIVYLGDAVFISDPLRRFAVAVEPGRKPGTSLLTCYVTEGMDAEAEHLLGGYENDAPATWRYNRALSLHCQEKMVKMPESS